MKNKAAAFHPFAYLAAFGISGAMGGMLMCVNTLMMLDRGLSLAQVALGLSLFSITQVLLEVPSGMLGDLYGRKRIWMAAMLVRLCYLPLFLFASGPILLAGYVGNGAANALNSGTLDAMYLENWLHARGKKTLARGTALQQAVQYGSQAAGALLGGGLSTLKFFRPYSGLHRAVCYRDFGGRVRHSGRRRGPPRHLLPSWHCRGLLCAGRADCAPGQSKPAGAFVPA